jgi:hypothetical protein
MRKRDEQKLEQTLDAILPDIENMSREEAKELLAEAGVDLQGLRARLQASAKEIATGLRKAGTPAPRYLTRAIEALEDGEKLPTTSDEAALARAADVLRKFRTPQPLPENARTIKAARFSPGASTKDDATAERLAEDLRKELEEDDSKKK